MPTLPEEIQVRPPTMSDVSTVLTLMLARDQAEYGEANMTEEHIQNFWQAPDFNMETDAWVVTVHDGSVIGYASIWHRQYTHIYTHFSVLPAYSYLPIKAYLLDLVERRAQEYLAEAPTEARVTLATGIADVNRDDQLLLAQIGYRSVRGQYRMEIEMDEHPLSAAWPEGITIRSCVPERDTQTIFEIEIEAFADSEGYTPPDFESWEHFNIKQGSFDPSLWFLACEGETIVGMCLCKYWGDAGHVSPLAVRSPWRRKGLGLALLRHSFSEFYRRGTRTVKLMVDTQNSSGAIHLYERAGMHTTQLYHQYQKELRAAKKQ